MTRCGSCHKLMKSKPDGLLLHRKRRGPRRSHTSTTKRQKAAKVSPSSKVLKLMSILRLCPRRRYQSVMSIGIRCALYPVQLWSTGRCGGDSRGEASVWSNLSRKFSHAAVALSRLACMLCCLIKNISAKYYHAAERRNSCTSLTVTG